MCVIDPYSLVGTSMTNELQNLHLLPTMAPALSDDPFAKALVKAVELELRSDYEEIQKIILLENLEKQSDNMLDHLARHYHVDFYDDTLTRKQKIALIRNSRAAHMYKGTKYAVELAFESLGLVGKAVEWWEEEDPKERVPGTFRMVIDVKSEITNNLLTQFDRLACAYKNMRSHLRRVELQMKIHHELFVGTISTAGETISIYPYQVGSITLHGQQKQATASYSQEILHFSTKGE